MTHFPPLDLFLITMLERHSLAKSEERVNAAFFAGENGIINLNAKLTFW